MGLKLTLPKECNNLYCNIQDAYWSLSDIAYDTNSCYFVLTAYPSREHKLMNGMTLPTPTLPIGGLISNIMKADLYRWKGTFPILDIFPDGIPLDENEQKTKMYNFIKWYTELPFEDVFEEEE